MDTDRAARQRRLPVALLLAIFCAGSAGCETRDGTPQWWHDARPVDDEELRRGVEYFNTTSKPPVYPKEAELRALFGLKMCFLTLIIYMVVAVTFASGEFYPYPAIALLLFLPGWLDVDLFLMVTSILAFIAHLLILLVSYLFTGAGYELAPEFLRFWVLVTMSACVILAWFGSSAVVLTNSEVIQEARQAGMRQVARAFAIAVMVASVAGGIVLARYISLGV